jgi:Vesicle coat trafficking protein Sec16 mid-region
MKISATYLFSEHLSLHVSACLMAGFRPRQFADMEKCDNELAAELMDCYDGAISALKSGLLHHTLGGRIVPMYTIDSQTSKKDVEVNSVDIEKSEVNVKDLQEWVAKHGVKPSYFLPGAFNGPDYLNPSHPRYSAKLAAVVFAWQAVEKVDGKSPKQALLKWLRENAASFGFTDADGNPQNSTLDDLAQVANWQTNGGAPKTPA